MSLWDFSTWIVEVVSEWGALRIVSPVNKHLDALWLWPNVMDHCAKLVKKWEDTVKTPTKAHDRWNHASNLRLVLGWESLCSWNPATKTWGSSDMGPRAKQLNRTGPLRGVQPCHSCNPIRMPYRSLVCGFYKTKMLWHFLVEFSFKHIPTTF